MGDQTTIEASERDSYEEDIERMARERADIEDKLASRERELEKIGEWSEAHCTEFQRKDETKWRDESVAFVFEFPDGETTTKQFSIESEPSKLKSFISGYDADSVTDMVGATHACFYTDSGWKLARNRSPRRWLYYQHVTDSGVLAKIPIHITVGYPTLLFASFAMVVSYNGGAGLGQWVYALSFLSCLGLMTAGMLGIGTYTNRTFYD